MPDTRPVVAQFTKRYLDPTHTWLHSQIALQQRWRAIVLSQRMTRAASAFPVDTHVSLAQLWPPARWWTEWQLRSTGRAPVLLRALRTSNARLLHAHFGMGGYRALQLARASGLPLVTTFYGADLSVFPLRDPRWRERYRELFAAGALFLIEGPHMREQLIALGCAPEKARVHHLGVDPERLQRVVRRPAEYVRVLVAARFTEKKGVAYAVEAFCRARTCVPQLRLTVIGDAGRKPAEQRVRQQLRDIIAQYRADDAVTLCGMQSYAALLAAYAQHDLLLAPSVHARDGDNEGGAPMTIVEAQATGMPVIATRHCDIPEIVVDGVTGMLVPERDVAELAGALVQLASSPERWACMGTAARAHIERRYNARVQADALADIYTAVAGVQ